MGVGLFFCHISPFAHTGKARKIILSLDTWHICPGTRKLLSFLPTKNHKRMAADEAGKGKGHIIKSLQSHLGLEKKLDASMDGAVSYRSNLGYSKSIMLMEIQFCTFHSTGCGRYFWPIFNSTLKVLDVFLFTQVNRLWGEELSNCHARTSHRLAKLWREVLSNFHSLTIYRLTRLWGKYVLPNCHARTNP